MTFARALPGLPVYGSAARSFPRADAYREGFVVEFETERGDTWVGNFAKWTECDSSIHAELGPRAVIVVAGGAGYVVDAQQKSLVREIGFDLQYVEFVAEIGSIVTSNGLWFEAFDAHRVLWRSRRLSWDGIRNIRRSGAAITGDAFNPMKDGWLPFRLNLATGCVEGGSYSGPD